MYFVEPILCRDSELFIYAEFWHLYQSDDTIIDIVKDISTDQRKLLQEEFELSRYCSSLLEFFI